MFNDRKQATQTQKKIGIEKTVNLSNTKAYDSLKLDKKTQTEMQILSQMVL